MIPVRNQIPSTTIFDSLPDDLYRSLVENLHGASWDLKSACRSLRDRTTQTIGEIDKHLFRQLQPFSERISSYSSSDELFPALRDDLNSSDPEFFITLHAKNRIFDPNLYRDMFTRKDQILLKFFDELRFNIPPSMTPELTGDLFEDARRIRAFLQANPLDASGRPVLDTIHTLDLSYTSLTALPPEICLLTHLTHFDISHTKISSLPKHFNPKRLEKFFAEYTCLTRLPEEFAPRTLKVLHLVGSPIVLLPEAFNLEELYWLDLTETSIDVLPKHFNPPKLKSLFLSDSPIRKMPSCLQLNLLDEFHLDGTPLEEIYCNNTPISVGA